MISLRRDLERIARRQLDSWGVSTFLLSETEVVTRFFVLQHRLLDPGPYTLHLSAAAAKALVLALPQEREGMIALLRRAQTRSALWPHQSRTLLARGLRRGPLRRRRLDPQHDGLLNDWGIQHLHLGTRLQPNGFVERTSVVAFVMAKGSDLFVIDFGRHPRAREWAQIEWLEIVDNHWPDLLPVMPYVKPGPGPLGGVGHQAARTAGFVTCVTLRSGRTLAPPGLGFSTSGHATKAMLRMSRVRQGILQLEQRMTELEPELRAALKCREGELDLHLDLDPETGELEVFASGRRLRSHAGERLPSLFGL